MGINSAAFDRLLREASCERVGSTHVCLVRNGPVSLGGLAHGRLFALASMGFLGSVDVREKNKRIAVSTKISNPVLACLGMQMGWPVGESLISGPVRLLAKKPSSVFEAYGFSESDTKTVVCVEGRSEEAMKKVAALGVKESAILKLGSGDRGQFVNIAARAVETVLFRLFLKRAKLSLKSAEGVCEVPQEFEGDIVSHVNECIRRNGRVVLHGSVSKNPGFVETERSKLGGKPFAELLREYGGIHRMSPEAFTVSEVSID